MGASISQVAQSTQPQGKGGFQAPQPGSQQSDLGNAINTAAQKGAATDYSLMQTDFSLQPGQGGQQMASPAVQRTGQFQGGKMGGRQFAQPSQGQQPQFGQPNNYPNTVGQWDNASIQPQQSQSRGGKGKG